MADAGRAHYVYVHRRSSDGRPFYVGKGKGRRAWSTSGRNRLWRFIVAKNGFTTEILCGGLPECCALTLERIVIVANRGRHLANFTDGGGGTSGWRHTEETKRRIGEHWKGRKMTAKQMASLAAYNAGKKLTGEHKAKLSTAKLGKKRGPLPADVRAKIAASHIGIRPSSETLLKMSLSKIGKAVGRNNPSYDRAIRHFTHPDHGDFIGTRGDFIAQFSLRDGCVSSLINGKQKSVKGWRLK